MAEKTGVTMHHSFSPLVYNFVPSEFCTYQNLGRYIVGWSTFAWKLRYENAVPMGVVSMQVVPKKHFFAILSSAVL